MNLSRVLKLQCSVLAVTSVLVASVSSQARPPEVRIGGVIGDIIGDLIGGGGHGDHGPNHGNHGPDHHGNGPTCDLYSIGAYNGFSYKYRVGTRGNVLDASDDLDSALRKLTNLQQNRLCEIVPQGICAIRAIGAYGAFSYKYRVTIERDNHGSVFAASDDYASARVMFDKLRAVGICAQPMPDRCEVHSIGAYGAFSYKFRIIKAGEVFAANDSLDNILQTQNTLARDRQCAFRPQGRCDLLGVGPWGAFSYRYRVVVNGETLTASDDMNTAMGQMNKLRNNGVCF